MVSWYNISIKTTNERGIYMSFCCNISQQMVIEDPLYYLTEREKKMLKDSWAEEFGNTIFPLINEDRFSVLYSDNPASRPNTPVNINIGLLMLKELFCQADTEVMESLIFDIRYQYALHTTSYEEQPISKNSLSNFRVAIYKYNEEHGVDLLQEEIESHAQEFKKILNIDGRTVRMDSLMVSSSCKKLSRLEIIYSCVERLIKKIQKENLDILDDNLKVYLEEGNRNDTIYRCKDKDIDSKMDTVISDAVKLFYLCQGLSIEEIDEYKTLSRMIGEQTNSIENNIELKPSKEISPTSLQNPTDPDATYRFKGKGHIGYVANVIEEFNDTDRILTQYDLKQNIYSDQNFSKDTIDKYGKQEEEINVIVDGAYYSEKISKDAKANNINFIPSNLMGRSTNEENKGYEKFNIDEDEQVVKSCPMGYEPIRSNFKKGVYTAHFSKDECTNCSNLENCPVKEQKKKYYFKVSETQLHRAQLMQEMETDEYKELINKRAGIEGIPSTLRRRYNIDNLPVRGEVRSKFWLGLKVSAINCKRFIKSRRNAAKEALSSLIYNHLLKILTFQGSIMIQPTN